MAEEQKSEEPKPAGKEGGSGPRTGNASFGKERPKEIERQRRQAEHWQQSHPGLRRVYFVIDTELWDRFVASCCAAQKPNAVFTRMIREAVQAKAEGF